jgi:N6-adenosine-specific RNA methylase IME4
MENIGLAKLENATRMLGEVRTIDDAKDLIDLAEAARVYAKQVKLGLEAQNHAAEIKIRAQRRAGEILDSMEKNKGAATRSQDVTALDRPATYAEMGIEKMDASRWQAIAQIPGEKFEEEIQAAKEWGKELTTAAMVRTARFEVAKQDKTEPPTIDGKYRIIYADPPWKYGDPLGIEGYKISAEQHYPVMSIAELCELPIKDMAEDNSVLFLWATSPLIEETFEVIRAWGFEYKTSFVWDKVKHNMGHYNSVRHEFLLVCTRGSCLPDNPKLYDSVQTIERTDHSVKPEEFRNIIDDLYTTGKRIELFARRQVDNWECWGNEST